MRSAPISKGSVQQEKQQLLQQLHLLQRVAARVRRRARMEGRPMREKVKELISIANSLYVVCGKLKA